MKNVLSFILVIAISVIIFKDSRNVFGQVTPKQPVDTAATAETPLLSARDINELNQFLAFLQQQKVSDKYQTALEWIYNRLSEKAAAYNERKKKEKKQ